ncbi:hypothetical protein O6H91_11G049200 [Diphasiastrum complanatum]|uniref:Uncharacterized protein n=1 Tax=Diphasiastrum complanatum TaxID=34168 RepID=A0ACC2C8V6_DIPCM|nr:hypothetical protein O6H91_11G049200 [Diphasiastrum complanatum]
MHIGLPREVARAERSGAEGLDMNDPPKHNASLPHVKKKVKQQGDIWPNASEVLQQQQLLQTMAGAEVRQLKRVASMEVQRQTQLGFMCGSLPVPTSSIAVSSSNFEAKPDAVVLPAISLHSQRLAPRYWLLPAETDLNSLPSDYGLQSESLMPITSILDAGEICDRWSMSYISQSLAWKCDTLAVHAIAGYGDEIDVVAPVDILKQIFKTPYSKARLSVAVHRIGRTLVLNSGPDTEEAEKLASRKKTQAKLERSLFSKFVRHSMHVPHNGHVPSPATCSRSKSPPTCPRYAEDFSRGPFGVNSHCSPVAQHQHVPWQVVDNHVLDGRNGSASDSARATSRIPSSRNGKQRVSWSCAPQSRCRGGNESMQKSRLFGEQQHDPDCARQDTEGQHRPSSEGFLRVLFWQFQNLRMLLGSDLLLFSNDKHVAVSLHLLELERQVTPLMWLDAWLDNIMASVPELAICYHRNGVVQGYELLKTDDIFLVKGLAEDGTAFFQPHLVQQNAMSVLRFLKENCKQDPGTYWLFKNAGEDLLQLFDLTVMSKTHSSCVDEDEKRHKTLPSLKNSYRGCYSLPLAMLLYRIAQRLSQSKDPTSRCKCAKLFQKCLDFLDEEEHLVMRASAHEQVARLILNCCNEQESVAKPLLLESIKTEHGGTTDVKEPSDKILLLPSKSVGVNDTKCTLRVMEKVVDDRSIRIPNPQETSFSEHGVEKFSSTSCSVSGNPKEFGAFQSTTRAVDDVANCGSGIVINFENDNSIHKNELAVCAASTCSSNTVQVLTDSVSARLAAVHHVSQAILSLRSQRQLHETGDHENKLNKEGNNHLNQFPLCLCGEIECFTLCDFTENELGFKVDQKLQKLVLLLGESYLALGQAYQEECQLGRALQAAELACTVYGSMLQDDKEKINLGTIEDCSDVICPPSKVHSEPPPNLTESFTGGNPCLAAESKLQGKVSDPNLGKDGMESKGNNCSTCRGLFWGQIWILLGDIYVDRSRLCLEQNSQSQVVASRCDELKISKEVAKEVKRLKKKIAQKRSCAICSLMGCSCQTDRVNSGSSASSSSSSFSVNVSKQTRKLGLRYDSRVKTPNLVHEQDLVIKNGDTIRANGKSQEGTSLCDLSSADKASFSTKAQFVSITSDSCIAAQTELQSSCIEAVKQQSAHPRDLFWFIKGPLISNPETNLSMAVECYESAVLALGDLAIGAKDLVSALRKKGWACNELGRRRLAHGDAQLAETTFDIAIRAFRKVGDFTNIVLVNCNLGHSRRASAEALVSQNRIYAENAIYQDDYVNNITDLKSSYREALKFYNLAKQELKNLPLADRQNNDLHNQVITQLAHTYLRLGMFLARDQQLSCNFDAKDKSADHANKGGTVKRNGNECMLAITAGDAIREALLLYESIGTDRAQEAAFSHFQLACCHRDWCQRIAASRGNEHPGEKGGASFQRLKRYFSLADRHWQKALEFYKADTHPDMFLKILMERSSLTLLLAPPSNPNQVADLSLSHLLEGRLAFPAIKSSFREVEAEEQEALSWPSPKIVADYHRQLQTLLRRMLAAAISASKNSCSGSSHPKKSAEFDQGDGHYQNTTQKGDVLKLKDMYRLSLKLSDRSDLESLHNSWPPS